MSELNMNKIKIRYYQISYKQILLYICNDDNLKLLVHDVYPLQCQ